MMTEMETTIYSGDEEFSCWLSVFGGSYMLLCGFTVSDSYSIYDLGVPLIDGDIAPIFSW